MNLKYFLNQVGTLILIFFCFENLAPCLAAPTTGQPLVTHSIYQSKSAWTTQDGKATRLESLRGRPTVAAMIYTSCQGSCPMMMADLKAIERGLSVDERKRVQFAVFAFDAKKDLPNRLKLFAEQHGVDLNYWSFFHGSSSSVRELAALLGVKVKQLEDGTFDHSNVISVLDAEGVIVRQQIGLGQKPEESVQCLHQLLTP